MLNKLKKTLEDIGLSPKEADVLFLLLQYESLRVSLISRKTKLNRTTLYGIIKGLVAKGLVSSFQQAGTTEYKSIDPNLLPEYVEQQRLVLAQKKDDLKKALPDIKKMRDSKDSLPRVYFFEGEDGIKQAYEDTLENNKGKIMFDFTGPDSIVETMGKEYIEYYVQKRAKMGIRCVQIAPDSEFSKITQSLDQKYLRETNLISDCTFDTEMVMYDDKFAIFSFSKEKPVAVIIEDENISKTMKALFGYVQKTLK